MDRTQTVEVLKALADETRLAIVSKLARCSGLTSSCDLVASCESRQKLSQPAMSHHFGKLVDAGVVIEQKVGTQKQYMLDKELLWRVGIDLSRL